MKERYIKVNTKCEKKKQGDLFGIFFEDLNHAADGGLYGELIQNRSFEFSPADHSSYHALTAWEKVERGNSVTCIHVESKQPLNPENEHYLTMEVLTDGEGGGIANEGYVPGICIETGKSYNFSCFYRLRKPADAMLEIRLESKDGRYCYAKEHLSLKAGDRQKLACELIADRTDYEARLVLLTKKAMILNLDMISLFPKETFRGRQGGLRKDIAEMLAELKPRFIRFPGGCLTHIGSLDVNDRCGMYRWKKTIGPVEMRPARRNMWNYNQTLGLGFYELFLFCEDIGAEPLPVISAGYDPHFLRMTELDDMQEWIDEALDLIEFANGDTNTKWGAVRTSMGHPESFHLKYLGIGNEEVGDAFFERYEIIMNAVKDVHPEIKVIGSAGPGSCGSEFEKGWKQAERTRTDYLDEHFYQCPEWFVANAERYEAYSGKTKAFLGEYASKDDTWKNALMEAAFMTGIEKAEGIGLACYAPLLCNVNYSNWKPDLLYYDNHRVYGNASYYIQKLFMTNQGEALLATEDNLVQATAEAPELSGSIAFRTDNADVEITNVLVKGESGIVYEDVGFMLNNEQKQRFICDMKDNNYTVFFTFRRNSGTKAESLEGLRSFELEFAKQDEKNRLVCRLDGWQQLLMMAGFYNGLECDLGNYQFEIENDRAYEVKLCVKGAQFTVRIDGMKYASHICRSTQPEELYYSAVKDADGSVIIKLVNVETEEKKIIIELSGDALEQRRVTVKRMEGFSLEDRNSFENPIKVSPNETIEKDITIPYVCELKGNSVAVLRFT